MKKKRDLETSGRIREKKKDMVRDAEEEGKPEKTLGGSKLQGNVEGPLLKQSMKFALAL